MLVFLVLMLIYAYAYVAGGVLTCYAYVMLMRF